ncbi:Hypothetical protein DHA2_152734 [Giardia duodenalis]|uniref:Uncharacterized protein n=1 Tax=Giardia intestinalis TaxID=5741 RepID=V6TGG7_GIAIN|nr:Hypothetical protein DHA2_152734 [Giardia intestinalis]
MQAGSLCCANARGCMDCVEPRHAPGCPYPFHGVCGCGSFDAADNVPQWNQQTMSPCPPLQCEPVTDNVGTSMEDVSRRTIPRSYMIRPTSFHPPPEQLPMSNSYTHINPLLDAAERGDPVPTVIGSQRAIERAQTVTSRPNPYPDLTATFPRTSQAGQKFLASNYRMCHPDMTGWGATTHVRYVPNKQELCEMRREQTRLEHLPESNCRWRPSLAYSDHRPRMKEDVPMNNERRPVSRNINHMYSDYYARPHSNLARTRAATADQIDYLNPTSTQIKSRTVYPQHPSNHPTAYSDYKSNLRPHDKTAPITATKPNLIEREADLLNKSVTIGTFTHINLGATPAGTAPLNCVTGRECVPCQGF